MSDLFENPMGLDGFEFVEFTAPERGVLEPVFEAMGFELVAKHKSKAVELWRQGDINFITNYEPGSHAHYYAEEHGPSACGHGLPGERTHTAAYDLRIGKRRPAGRNLCGPHGTEIAGHQRHRRRHFVPDRSLRRRQNHLRHRLRLG